MNTHQRGFTLIEVVIYIALFSILIGGVVVSAYTILESNGRSQTERGLVQEGNFLLDKINWIMLDCQTINYPLPNTSSTNISIDTWASTTNPYIIETIGNNITIQKGTSTPQVLNNPDYSIENTKFIHIQKSENNFVSHSLYVEFILHTRTLHGSIISEKFSAEFYIK